MNKDRYNYFLLLTYLVFLGFFLYEILESGLNNIRIYQVLLFSWSVFIFVQKILEVLKNKKDNQ
jgi:hypothetical protein